MDIPVQMVLGVNQIGCSTVLRNLEEETQVQQNFLSATMLKGVSELESNSTIL